MGVEGYAWIYLVFFLIIPLSRVLPKVVRKWKEKNRGITTEFAQKTNQTTNETITESPPNPRREDIPKEMKPESLDMLILGELNRGAKNFNSIQKNLGIDSKTLDKSLQSLEQQGLMEIQHKQGLLGPKIELIPTEKGFKKFYS